MKKKLLVAFMLLCLLLMGASSFEVKAQEQECYSMEVTYVNPLYADVVSEEELKSVPRVYYTDGETVYLETVEEAGAIVRDKMEERAATITVSVKYHEESNQVAYDVFDEALEHTGVPTEGDYLAFTYGGWNGSLKYYSDGTCYYFTITYNMQYYTTAEQEAEMDTAVDTLLATLALDAADDYTKVCGIYDYMCDNIVYDHENLNNDAHKLKYTAYAALVNGTSVCQGYANLFYRLALELGVDARIIAGDAGGPHSWNIVKLGDVYYNLDATWDAGRSEYDYFLQNPEGFAADHTRETEFDTEEFHAAYPMSDVDYSDLPVEEDLFEYEIADGEATLTGYLGNKKLVVIPERTKDGYPVTKISYYAFLGNNTIESVTIPASVVTIEDGGVDEQGWVYGTFAGCTNLKTVLFAENSQLSTIGILAFYASGVTKITLPASVRTVRTSSFEFCEALEEIDLTEGLETVEEDAFNGTGLKNIHIPASCTSFHSSNQGRNLETFTVAEGNARYRAHEGVLYDKEPMNSSYTGWTLVAYPQNKKDVAYTVAEYCTHINGDAMAWGIAPYLKMLYILDAVGIIGSRGEDTLGGLGSCTVIPAATNDFYMTENNILYSKDKTVLVQVPDSITGVLKVPDGVESINGYVFYNNTSLKKIILPESISAIGEFAFAAYGYQTEAEVLFTGDAPQFAETAFYLSAATVYYPQDNATWTEEVRKDYYGYQTWVPYSPTGVKDFVSRLYTVILGREADEAGLAEWTSYLVDGVFTGAEVAKGFIMSDEFLNKDMTNEEFVQILYSAFFGREADPDGLATWVNFLNEGYRKSFVFAGFANSNEFAALCEGYGVAAGSVPVTISEQQPNLSDADYNVWLFVERMYTEVLDRSADMAGIQEWVGLLKAGTWTGAEVASGFILSSEFQAKDMTNEEYVQIMYKAFFGREADPSGLETWVNALETSYTKEFVFAGFANSAEFGVLCANYGIRQGQVEIE